MVEPEQKVPPPPALIVAGILTVAITATLGVEVQLPRVASI